jgi:glyoxylase-like metal-dependent hydrolase (beta-lactamase superfamily II)
VIENNGMRMMIDAGVALPSRKVLNKIKELGLFPIHKILLTHSHWDHVQGYTRLKKLFGDFETLASEKAINNLKNPEIMLDGLNITVDPIEDVTPLKEGDIIDLNGLKLEVFNFFGHTMDSIAILDRKNKNIFTGDAIISKFEPEFFISPVMAPDFNESELLKTYQKLRDMKSDLNSISLGHFGVYNKEHFSQIVDEVEDLYFKTKDSICQWYGENPSLEYIAEKYHETYTPNSTIHTKVNLSRLELLLSWAVNGFKKSGIIK